MKIIPGSSLIAVLVSLFLSACSAPGVDAVTDQSTLSAPALAPDNRDLSCAYFYFLWGTHAEFDNRLDEALEAYEKALVCDPSADYIKQKLPLLLMKRGDTEQAKRLLEQAIEEQPHDTARRSLLASILIQQQQRLEAIDQYRAILSYEPENGQALLRLGVLLSQIKQYQQAQQVLEQLLQLGQEPYLAHLYLARVALQLDNIDSAASQYLEALDLNWSADLAYELAEMYQQSKQYEKAIAVLRSVLATDETDERARLGIVQALLAMNQEEAAITELGLAQQYSISPERISIVLSRLYMRLDQQDKAIDNLLAVIKTKNNNEARYLLAIIYASKERFAEALAQLEHIGPDDEGYEDTVFLRTKILHETNRTPQALQELEAILSKQDSVKPMLILLAASLHRELGNDQRSLELLSLASEQFPDNEQVLFEYGLQLERHDRLEEAISVMERIIVVNPEHAEALNFVGYCLADANRDLDRALEYINRAMELKPGNGYIQDSLGWVYFRLGNYERAERELLGALHFLPDDPNVHEHLGDLYNRTGRADQARSYYHNALEKFTDEKKKDTVRRKLEALETN